MIGKLLVLIIITSVITSSLKAQDFSQDWSSSDAYDTHIGEDFVSLNSTIIRLRATEEPGAIAEVYIDNQAFNVRSNDGSFELNFGEVKVIANYTLDARGASSDGFSVEVIEPKGYVAIPEYIEVPEYQEAIIYIFPLIGMRFWNPASPY